MMDTFVLNDLLVVFNVKMCFINWKKVYYRMLLEKKKSNEESLYL